MLKNTQVQLHIFGYLNIFVNKYHSKNKDCSHNLLIGNRIKNFNR